MISTILFWLLVWFLVSIPFALLVGRRLERSRRERW
jgi:hypothetical protein